jgi:hypothetical protein
MGTDRETGKSQASHLTLRRSIGTLGILLPITLAGGQLLVDPEGGLQVSISAYYATPMRDVLVGVLFAIGAFFFAYKGYDRHDDLVTDLACICCVGLVLFPSTSGVGIVEDMHMVLGMALFLLLAYTAAVRFTLTDPHGTPTPAKLRRNRVYVASGVIMIASIALGIVYYTFLAETVIASYKPIFWLEALALWAVGWSWFVKGETLLTDEVERT